MRQMPLKLTALFLTLSLLGCDTGPRYDYTIEYPDNELIANARREIDHERKLRQSIVLIVPKEKAVIEALHKDERVASAQFVSVNTYLTAQYLAPLQTELADGYWFVVHFEAAADLTADQAQAVVGEALKAAGLNPTSPKFELANEGRSWATAQPFEATLAPLGQPEPLTSSSFEHLIQP